ncbi:DUF305 domain-containing protein [Gordonia sp. zg691]|uniref:DUF305 domain-containing protein n=1 Tax=Gordonia jinghuaiqii TaxID=2758710 RepID=UPI0016627082|nr:DUF305 domain-containing protein [Gordonia jinghuaiqii]MBD0860464.1 DUF305 domain-containing protein [Gordonia jinghuaiqii]
MSLPRNSTVRRRVPAVSALGIAAAAALVLAGCSPDESPGSARSAGPQTSSATMSSGPAGGSSLPGAHHNDADVDFNSTMIGHHRQAVMMAELVEGRTDNPQLIALAAAIEKAQEREIDQMEDRLESWGVDDDGPGMGPGMGHGGHSDMPGMLTANQMMALRDARGPAFDKLWLEGMIRHHEGAIAMADAVLTDGVDPGTKALATEVEKTQQAEIDQMKKMLGQG